MVGRRLFGIETEYAFTAFSKKGKALPRSELLREFMALAKARLPNVQGLNSPGFFLHNGSRLYVDAGQHPELGTPECTSPRELVRYARAGDRILANLAAELEKTHPLAHEVALFTCNVDYNSRNTWGSHESYNHTCEDRSVLVKQLVPHLVSRILYTGAGGFDNRYPGMNFMVSPRVAHLQAVVASGSTGGRGIYHTRDETLAAGGHHRLHLLCGESVRSERALRLRVGTTALVLALAEAGRDPARGVALKRPLEALQKFTADPDERYGKWTALTLQRHYLERVEAELGSRLLPPWAASVCEEWRRILDLHEHSPESLDTVLDWRIKRRLFSDFARRSGFEWAPLRHWDDPLCAIGRAMYDPEAWPVVRQRLTKEPLHRLVLTGWGPFVRVKCPGVDWDELEAVLALRADLCQIDTRFGQLGPRGTFSSLDEAGVLDHRIPDIGDVDAAMSEPPGGSRAALRGNTIRALHGRGVARGEWTGVWDFTGKRALDLADPFATQERWQQFDPEGSPPIFGVPARS